MIAMSNKAFFLSRLGRLQKDHMPMRDLLVLWCVIENPGIQGLDVAAKLGMGTRSAIQASIPRLIGRGFIEDRRVKARQTVPNILHALPPGIEYFEKITT